MIFGGKSSEKCNFGCRRNQKHEQIYYLANTLSCNDGSRAAVIARLRSDWKIFRYIKCLMWKKIATKVE